MAIFRCNRSGNTMSVNNEDDIAVMRKHEGYTEVVNEASTNAPIKVSQAPKAEVLKHRGRPRKVK